MDVDHVLIEISRIPDPMVGETPLPHLPRILKLLLGTIRESSLNELGRFLQCSRWRDQQVKVVVHDHELMEQIGIAPIVINAVQYELYPALVSEERFPSGSL
jgi:hypothetical protein